MPTRAFCGAKPKAAAGGVAASAAGGGGAGLGGALGFTTVTTTNPSPVTPLSARLVSSFSTFPRYTITCRAAGNCSAPWLASICSFSDLTCDEVGRPRQRPPEPGAGEGVGRVGWAGGPGNAPSRRAGR